MLNKFAILLAFYNYSHKSILFIIKKKKKKILLIRNLNFSFQILNKNYKIDKNNLIIFIQNYFNIINSVYLITVNKFKQEIIIKLIFILK